MKNIALYLLFVFAIVIAYGFVFSIAQQEEKTGKDIFVDQKCNMYHTVESMEISSKKKDAYDLSKLEDKYDTEFLIKFLQKEEAIDGNKHKMIWKGSDEELEFLATWLSNLNTAE